MFRKMRRFEQQLSDRETTEILMNGRTAVISVLGDDGYPYTVPINYVYSENKIYFHCAKEGHKIDAVKACDKVSLCVIDKDDVDSEKFTALFRSVILFGRARILDDEQEIINAAEALGLKYNNNKEAVDEEIKRDLQRLCCVEIVIEHVTGKECIEFTKKRVQRI